MPEGREVKVLLAGSAGFCFGVKRATKMAFQASEEHERICSLGPIIHSPQVVERLEEKGVEVIQTVEDIVSGAVVIRSHGVTLCELEAIVEKDLKIIDATCPFVKKAHENAEQLGRQGYTLVIVGEKEHPEVQGIVSYARSAGDVYVVATAEEAERLALKGKIGLVAQTTQSFDNFSEVVKACLRKGREVRVFNTICDATSVRQNEACEIARQSDLVLVIGGYNSANTARLAKICKAIQPRTHHIETVLDLKESWFDGVSIVGITAGASTPKWIIDEVVEKVESQEK